MNFGLIFIINLLIKNYFLQNLYSIPQQSVNILTTVTSYSWRRSTDHQGEASLKVSMHLPPFCDVVISLSLAFSLLVSLAIDDWFTGLPQAMFVAETNI